jgi:hypothetical protein
MPKTRHGRIGRLDWLGRIVHDDQGAYFDINLD